MGLSRYEYVIFHFAMRWTIGGFYLLRSISVG